MRSSMPRVHVLQRARHLRGPGRAGALLSCKLILVLPSSLLASREGAMWQVSWQRTLQQITEGACYGCIGRYARKHGRRRTRARVPSSSAWCPRWTACRPRARARPAAPHGTRCSSTSPRRLSPTSAIPTSPPSASAPRASISSALARSVLRSSSLSQPVSVSPS